LKKIINFFLNRNNAIEEDDIAITDDGVIDNVFNGIPGNIFAEGLKNGYKSSQRF